VVAGAAARALAWVLVVALAAGGCGAEHASQGDPAGPKPTAQPEEAGDASAHEVAILTATAAGGEVDTTPFPLRTDADLVSFTSQFTNERFARQIRKRARATTVEEHQTLMVAVIAIGCDVPTESAALGPPGAMTISAVADGTSPQECFAPMTSVALWVFATSLLRD
jgi:hypothetical protein